MTGSITLANKLKGINEYQSLIVPAIAIEQPDSAITKLLNTDVSMKDTRVAEKEDSTQKPNEKYSSQPMISQQQADEKIVEKPAESSVTASVSAKSAESPNPL